MNLSGVILTKNNQDTIVELIKSLSFCDEVLVIDDKSSDETVKRAESVGAKVFVRSLDNDFSSQRNYGLNKAKGEWVLFVDSDEKLSEKLSKEIIRVIKTQDYDGYQIKREDIFLGRKLKYGETGQMWLLRLGRRKAGRWGRSVHEEWQIKPIANSHKPKVNKNIRRLGNPLVHYSHKNLTGFLNKIIKYSRMEAEYRVKSNQKVRWWEIIVYPLAKFVQNYFIKLGFRDGIPGLIMAFMMSIHSFLVRVFYYEKSRQ